MADRADVKRVLRAGIRPGAEMRITEQQLNEAVARVINNSSRIQLVDLERIGTIIANDPIILAAVDLSDLNNVLDDIKKKRT